MRGRSDPGDGHLTERFAGEAEAVGATGKVKRVDESRVRVENAGETRGAKRGLKLGGKEEELEGLACRRDTRGERIEDLAPLRA